MEFENFEELSTVVESIDFVLTEEHFLQLLTSLNTIIEILYIILVIIFIVVIYKMLSHFFSF